MNHLLPDASISTVRSQSGFSRARSRKATFSVLCGVLEVDMALTLDTRTAPGRESNYREPCLHDDAYVNVWICLYAFLF